MPAATSPRSWATGSSSSRCCSASQLSGMWVAAVNWHLTAAEIAYILEDSGCARRSSPIPSTRRWPARRSRWPARRSPCVVAGDELDGALAAAGRRARSTLDGPAGGTMLYTSGTTGRPKGVKRARRRRSGATLATGAAGRELLGLDGAGPHLVTGPLYHAAPLGFALMDLAQRRADDRDHAALGRGRRARLIEERRRPQQPPRADDVRAPAAPARRRPRAAFDRSSLRHRPARRRADRAAGEAADDRVVGRRCSSSTGARPRAAWSRSSTARTGSTTRAPSAGRCPPTRCSPSTPTASGCPPARSARSTCRNTVTDEVFEYHKAPGEDRGRPPRARARSRSATSAGSTTTATCTCPTAPPT